MAATHPVPSVVAHRGDLTIRLLRNDRTDAAMMDRWRRHHDAHAWWADDAPATCEQIAAHHGAYTHPSSPTTPCIVEVGRRPVGYVRFYRWTSFARQAHDLQMDFDDGTFGIDLRIAEAAAFGRGIGSRTIDLLCEHLANGHAATGFALTTRADDLRAQRAYERAGFTRVREVLEPDDRGDRRVRCWLMTRPA